MKSDKTRQNVVQSDLDEAVSNLPGRREDYDEAINQVTQNLAAKTKKAKLTKKKGLAATVLIASTVLLTACSGQDCVTVRQAPASSNITNPADFPVQTYCTTDRAVSNSYGRGFYYIGIISGGSSYSGGYTGGGSRSS
jgi:hypothetical protein